MGRRSDHSKEELYELAINAGQEIVNRDGYRALTARNVADAIGYSAGTLYNHFANLDELIIHLNARTLDHLNDELSALTFSGQPNQDIRRVLSCYLEFIETHSALWHMLMNYTLPQGAELPEWYSLKVQRALAIVEDILRPLFAGKDPQDLVNFTRVLWASLHGITSLADTDKLQVITHQSAQEMAELLISTMLRGAEKDMQA